MGADFCDISGGEVIAVFGAGPVGQFAIASAVMLGAEQVIAIDQYDYRLQMARNKAGATDVINFAEDADIVEQLKELTGGRGPDAVIDAVGMEAAHGHGALHAYDRVKQPPAWRPTAATRCATPSWPAAPAGSCRSSASTAG
jgi:threonine dehydrogenase-like Zn-dependent dehydrogenase